jgi:hypothetical protein
VYLDAVESYGQSARFPLFCVLCPVLHLVCPSRHDDNAVTIIYEVQTVQEDIQADGSLSTNT